MLPIAKMPLKKMLMMAGIITLAGCVSSQDDNQTISNQQMNNSGIVTSLQQNSTNGLNEQGSQPVSAPMSTCVKELNSLKSLSPKDYSELVASFKEISEINKLYRSVEDTASPDTLKLLQMSIEAKTKVLCAKVRYSSVLSVESTLEKVNGL